MYEDVETSRTPRPRRQYPSGELLSNDLLPTLRRGTSETGNFGDQAHRSPSQRQIGNTTLITAMDPMTVSSARGTTARFRNAANHNDRSIAIAGPATIAKPVWMMDEGQSAFCMTMIPSGANAIRPHNCIKIESEPFFDADLQSMTMK